MKSYSKPKKCTHPRYSYYVKYTDAEGKRNTKFFKTLDEAQNFFERGNIQVANAGFEVAGLPEADRKAYIEARNTLKPFNISVLDAIKEYSQAMKELAPYDADITKAVNLFKKHNEIKKHSVSLFQAYGEYLDNLNARGLSIRHIDSQEHRLERFIKDMGDNTLVAMIDTKKVEKWLYNLKACRYTENKKAEPRKNGTFPKTMQQTKESISAKTKNNYRTALCAFFEFCCLKEYIKENPINKISKVKEEPEEPEIYTVEELQYILNCTEEGSDIRAYIAIGAFAGLRRAEIERLTWNKIDLSDKTITLDGKIVKTSQRRIVKISENLAQWLAPYSLKTNTKELVVGNNFQDRLERFIKKYNVQWKHNALRHSSASYYLALIGDEYKTAEQMGHSIRVLKTNYKGLVKEKDANKFFNILPKGTTPIIPFTSVIKSQTA